MKPTGGIRSSVNSVLLIILLCSLSYLLGLRHGASSAEEAGADRNADSGPAALPAAQDRGHSAAVTAGEPGGSAAPDQRSAVPEADRDVIETEQKQRLMRNLSENLAMPGMSRIIRDQQRVLMTDQFRSLIETLGLNDREKEYLIDLLTARQMYHVDMGMKLMTGMLSDDERAELLKRVGEGIDEMNREIDWFLNNETDSEYFRYYERTEGERALVDSVSSRLSQAGHPLADGLDRELVAIMHEEISAYPFSVEFEENGEPVFSRFTAENIDTFMTEMQALRDPLIQQATAVLTPEQLEVFAGSFDQYTAFYDQRLRMVQQLFNPAKQ